jgi:SAM-dependent methyltransferase
MTRTWHPSGPPPATECIICHAPGPIPPLVEEAGHVLHRCPVCRACFYADRTMPDYEIEEQPEFYQQVYLEQNASIHHVTRTLFLVEDDRNDSLLDVGCGFGFAVDMASKTLGWRAVGIDPAHYARAGAALLHADIRKDYLTADSDLGEPFGLVVASEVIEHVPDPDGFLQILRRWLRPGGTLVLTTPDGDAVHEGAGEADLVTIMVVGGHLILYSLQSLELVLRRAGFAHVEVETRQNNLIALASDRPIRRRVNLVERHFQAYRTYLTHLLDANEPGSALWNGAAGRLLSAQALGGPIELLHALFARIAAAWLERFGIDLVRMRLPPILPERAYVNAGKEFMWQIGPKQPINLAVVLFGRAILENRRAGRLPEEVLRWARPAYRHAVETARVLMTGTMIDLDLRATAWRARMLIADCLIELAPEMEGEILAGLAAPSPGALQERIGLPADLLIPRLAPWFTRMVQTDRFDEAARVAPWLSDIDEVARVLADDPFTLFYALFNLGVLRMVHEGRAQVAATIFSRLAHEAETRLAGPNPHPQTQGFRQIALEHVALAQNWNPPAPPDAPPAAAAEPPPAAAPEPNPEILALEADSAADPAASMPATPRPRLKRSRRPAPDAL